MGETVNRVAPEAALEEALLRPLIRVAQARPVKETRAAQPLQITEVPAAAAALARQARMPARIGAEKAATVFRPQSPARLPGMPAAAAALGLEAPGRKRA